MFVLDISNRGEKTDSGNEKELIDDVNGDEPMDVTACTSRDVEEGDKSITLCIFICFNWINVTNYFFVFKLHNQFNFI